MVVCTVQGGRNVGTDIFGKVCVHPSFFVRQGVADNSNRAGLTKPQLLHDLEDYLSQNLTSPAPRNVGPNSRARAMGTPGVGSVSDVAVRSVERGRVHGFCFGRVVSDVNVTQVGLERQWRTIVWV